MAAIDRKAALCSQTRLTGIDFVQVVDAATQDLLRLFFVVDPSSLAIPLVDPADLLPPGTAVPAGTLDVEILGLESERSLEIAALDWRLVTLPSGERVALEISLPAPGGFELHRLTITDSAVDPFLASVVFSFKQACEQDFDCRTDCTPEAEDRVDVPIDYLARDFWSLRRALLDFYASRYPGWSEPLVADQVVMLTEIMAALGDELAYTQDRYAHEANLLTATQRRSRAAHARLVDYTPDPGHAATTELVVTVGSGGHYAAVGARVYALPEGRAPVAFAVEAPVWHHAAWNELALYQPDSAGRCLPEGATEAYLVTAGPGAAELPPDTTLAPFDYWRGRRAILRARPADASEAERGFAVTLTEVTALTDELTVPPTALVRIGWTEPTPWPLPLEETSAFLNVVTVRAGDRVVEHFRVGPDAAIEARFAGLCFAERRAVLALPRAVEREGPWLTERGGRGRILRYGLRRAESEGLGWAGARDPLGIGSQSQRKPLLSLQEVEPPALTPDPAGRQWQFLRDLLDGDLDTNAFTLEEGTWRDLVTHQTPFEDVVFQDYASDAGWSLRFGEGAFGRPPADGTVFKVCYRTAPGTAANLAPDSVRVLALEGGAPELTYATAVTNPLPISDGQGDVEAETVRIDAPEAFRSLPLRAVRPEDYQSILERIDFVQRAHSVTRWTGSWSTDFIAADPRGGFALARDELAHVEAVVDCVRQAGRDARVRQPDYVDIDLEIDVCVTADAYAGEVVPRVEKALAAPGFFSPDNFTFGQPLRRSALEAAIQAVGGIKAVEAIRVRVRRRLAWQPFAEPEIPVEPWQIIRLQNDPLLPGRGSLHVYGRGGAS
ncbi:hypothetical protein ABC977_17015 [Thioalkalicoccus limnaeus]|uniref:Baseplate protein J-like domain-containing protein n=1 Tax=Thioalkalicoccus limnaeus TaxID=120681 RepID=A0ABV4BIK2_9GAMM